MFVVSIATSPNYSANATLYAVHKLVRCDSDCILLLRSTDGGASWHKRAARGWTGAEMIVAGVGGDDVLVSPGTTHVEVSYDGGATFGRTLAPKGQLDAVRVDAHSSLVVVTSAPGKAYLLSLPDDRARTVSGTSLRSATIKLHPRWPDVPSGQPSGIASGIDPASELPVVQQCDRRLACRGGTVVASAKGLAKIYLSPNFAHDATIFAATATGGVFRSRDFGKSFAPVIVAQDASKDVVTTVQDMRFTSDFDATSRRGSGFAAVVSVAGVQSGSGSLSGGVYRTADGGSTWQKVGGASPLDQGATVLTLTPDARVVAGSLNATNAYGPPMLCSMGFGSWRSSCPPARAASGVVTPASQASSTSAATDEFDDPRPEDLAAGERSSVGRRWNAPPVFVALAFGITVTAVVFFARRSRRAARAADEPETEVAVDELV